MGDESETLVLKPLGWREMEPHRRFIVVDCWLCQLRGHCIAVYGHMGYQREWTLVSCNAMYTRGSSSL
jgi:hypothetical protein